MDRDYRDWNALPSVEGIWVHVMNNHMDNFEAEVSELMQIKGEICVSSPEGELFAHHQEYFAVLLAGTASWHFPYDCWSERGEDGLRFPTRSAGGAGLHDEAWIVPSAAKVVGFMGGREAARLATLYKVTYINKSPYTRNVNRLEQRADGRFSFFFEGEELVLSPEEVIAAAPRELRERAVIEWRVDLENQILKVNRLEGDYWDKEYKKTWIKHIQVEIMRKQSLVTTIVTRLSISPKDLLEFGEYCLAHYVP